MQSTSGQAFRLPGLSVSPREVPSAFIWAVEIRTSANTVCRTNKGSTMSQNGGHWRHHGCLKLLAELDRDACVILIRETLNGTRHTTITRGFVKLALLYQMSHSGRALTLLAGAWRHFEIRCLDT